MSRRKLRVIVRDARAIPLNPGRPDAEVQEQLPLVQHVVPDALRSRFPPGTPTKVYTLGECSIVVTRNLGKLWHLSIAHPDRYPTWDEISQARYRCVPKNIWMAMYLPPPHDYTNIHRNCFQLVE